LRLTSIAVGRELTSLGYNQDRDEKGRRVYYCVPLSTSQTAAQLLVGIEPFNNLKDDLPF